MRFSLVITAFFPQKSSQLIFLSPAKNDFLSKSLNPAIKPLPSVFGESMLGYTKNVFLEITRIFKNTVSDVILGNSKQLFRHSHSEIQSTCLSVLLGIFERVFFSLTRNFIAIVKRSHSEFRDPFSLLLLGIHKSVFPSKSVYKGIFYSEKSLFSPRRRSKSSSKTPFRFWENFKCRAGQVLPIEKTILHKAL